MAKMARKFGTISMHLLLLILVFNAQAFAKDPPPFLPSPCEALLSNSDAAKRLTRLHEIYINSVENNPVEHVRSIIEILQNPEIIPVDGSVHVVGPGEDFYQWAVFLLVRPDVKITVSERPGNAGFNLISDLLLEGSRDRFWKNITRDNPALVEYSVIKTFEQFVEEARKRIKLIPSFYYDFEGNTPERTDLIFARYPMLGHSNMIRDLVGGAKAGTGLIWVTTEKMFLDYYRLTHGVRLDGEVGRFLGSGDSFDRPKPNTLFKGYEYSLRSYAPAHFFLGLSN